jgi:hypothetical protein
MDEATRQIMDRVQLGIAITNQSLGAPEFSFRDIRPCRPLMESQAAWEETEDVCPGAAATILPMAARTWGMGTC